MKTISRKILSFQEDSFFFPIRHKPDYAILVAHSIRQLLMDDDEGEETPSSMKLIIDKMSRLFFYKENRFYSVAFPFTITTDGNTVSSITSRLGVTIDNKSVSSIISILKSKEFQTNPSLIDLYIEPSGIEMTGISLLEEIFQFEPSYVRYDIDPERVNGKIHPLHHLDINYSQPGTFKLGFIKEINTLNFEDIHNTKTECYFLY